MLEYALLTALFLRAARIEFPRACPIRAALYSALAAALYGLSDEWHQLSHPAAPPTSGLGRPIAWAPSSSPPSFSTIASAATAPSTPAPPPIRSKRWSRWRRSPISAPQPRHEANSLHGNRRLSLPAAAAKNRVRQKAEKKKNPSPRVAARRAPCIDAGCNYGPRIERTAWALAPLRRYLLISASERKNPSPRVAARRAPCIDAGCNYGPRIERTAWALAPLRRYLLISASEEKIRGPQYAADGRFVHRCGM
ncbi:VanZ family protein [bacterium]|nr:VanZ family protein [bacterium]